MWKTALGIAALLACAPAFGGALDAVESKQIRLHDFRLDSGVVLPTVTICYETYGPACSEWAQRRAHHAQLHLEPDMRRGFTRREELRRDIALATLGGGTRLLDPKTGKPYGPDFPAITVSDMVRAQKAMVDALGVKPCEAPCGGRGSFLRRVRSFQVGDRTSGFCRWSVAGEYVDVGISGTKKTRPQLDKLMADAHRRRFDAMIVWKFDRFARSVSHLLRALETFNAVGVAFVSLSESLDTSTPAGRMVFYRPRSSGRT